MELERVVERVVAMVFGRPDSDVPRRCCQQPLVLVMIREERFSATHRSRSLPATIPEALAAEDLWPKVFLFVCFIASLVLGDQISPHSRGYKQNQPPDIINKANPTKDDLWS